MMARVPSMLAALVAVAVLLSLEVMVFSYIDYHVVMILHRSIL
jgi:hypothetical protein